MSWLTELADRYAGRVAIATGLAYLAGFLITSIYLASLGIVNMDLLRARYILTGVLFLIFVGIPTGLSHGLLQVLRQYWESPPTFLLRKATAYSLVGIGVALFIVGSLGYLGEVIRFPVLPISLDAGYPWSDWANTSLRRLAGFWLWSVAVLFGSFVATRSVGFLRERRWRILQRWPRRDLVTHIALDTAIVLVASTIVPSLIIVGATLLSLISFLYTRGRPIVGISWPWWLFALVATLLYLGYAISLVPGILHARLTRAGELPPQVDEFWPQYFRLLPIGALLLSVVVPVYSLAIYPVIPQPLGGGLPVPIRLQVESADSARSLRGSLELVDRTSDGSLLLVLDADIGGRRVIEVPANQIRLLQYGR
jgi:hypothetical protein